MLRVGSKVSLFVTTVDAQGSRLLLSAQTDNDSWENIESLMTNAGTEFDGGNVLSIDKISPGDICVAKYEDGVWYRAQVLSADASTSKVGVNFIDFGNTENVGVSDIKRARPQFFELPPQAQKMVFDELLPSHGDTWSKDELSYIQENLVNGEFVAEITEEGNGVVPCKVRLFDGSSKQSVIDKMINNGVGRRNEAHVFPKKVCSLSLQVGSCHPVYVTYSHSPLNFWVQLVASEEEVAAMSSQMEANTEPETNIFPGQLCVSHYGDDPTLYRAIITDVNTREQVCSLAFLDYGNTEHDIPFSSLKVLQPQFSKLPAQAVACCLTGEKVGQSNFNQIVEQEDLQINVMKVLGSGVHIVQFVDGSSQAGSHSTDVVDSRITNHIDREGITGSYPSAPVDVPSMHDLCISYIDRDGTFYSQQLENALAIDNLMCQLQTMRHVPVNQLTRGAACTVRSSTDDLFYRAEVQDQSSNQVLVQLVDFGDMETTSKQDLFETPGELRNFPRQCLKCQLTNTTGATAIAQLKKYTSKIPLVGQILSKQDDTFEIELYDTSSSRDIMLSELIHSQGLAKPGGASKSQVKPVIPSNKIANGKEVKLFVTTVQSNSSFFGQLTSYDSATLDDFQSKLHGHYSSQAAGELPNMEIGDVCCTTFSQDGLHYRAKLLKVQGSECTVLFVDYGNSECKSVRDLKPLLPEFCHLPEQGITCRLSSSYVGVSKEDLETAVLDQEVLVKVVGITSCYEVSFSGNDPLQRFKRSPQSDNNAGLSGVSSDSGGMEYVKQTVPVGRWEEVLVSHIDNPEHLYCQRVGTQAALNDLHEKIEVYATACQDRLQSVSAGQPIIAKDSSGEWFRAQVLVPKSPAEVEVNFVDYGNQETVLYENIRPMKAEFMKLPCQALHSCLVGVDCSDDGIWSPDETDQLWKLVDVSKLIFNVHDYDAIEDHYAVELFDQRKSLNVVFGKSIGKLNRQFMSAGPPPDELPSANTEVTAEQISANTWAKGFKESNKKTQPPNTQPAVDSWRDERSNDTLSARQKDRSPGFGSKFEQRNDSSGYSGADSRTGGNFRQGDQGFGTQNQGGSRGFGGQGRDESRGFGSGQDRQGSSRDGGFGTKVDGIRGGGGRKSSWDTESPRKADTSIPTLSTAKLRLMENEYMDVFVSFAAHPGQFWCQLAKNYDDLGKLMEELENEYTSLGPNDLVCGHPSKSQLCCAKYSEDKAWYRAKITNICGDSIEVVFVDYGNAEKVTKSDVKLLKENYLTLPFQAFQCKLSGIEPMGDEWSTDAINKFHELTLDKSVVACIVQKKGECCTVELIDHSNQVGDELVKMNLARSLEDPQAPTGRKLQRKLSSASTSSRTSTSSRGSNAERGPREIKQLQLANNKVVDVNISYIDTPGNFWCHVTQNSGKLENLMAKLKAKYGRLLKDDLIITAPEPGLVCCAKFTEDEEWYRATVSEIQPGKVKVNFVDYGNEEWTTTENLRELDPSFVDLEAQAIKCSLYGIKPVPAGKWSDDSATKFEGLAAEKNLIAKVVSSKSGICQIRLIDIRNREEFSIGDELIKLGLAEYDTELVRTFKQPDVKMGQSYNAVISWIVGPCSFYCQLENFQSDLERLSADLFEFYQRLKLNDMAVADPHIGQACVSYYAPDGNWYRGTILKLRQNEAMVMYIDYGNKAKVPLSKVKEIKSPFIEIPQQAVHCELHGLEYAEDKWNQEAINAFKKSLSDVVSCKFMSKNNNVYAVEVIDSENISVAENVNSICRGNGPIVSKKKPAPAQSQPKNDDWGTDDLPVPPPQPKAASPPKASMPKAASFKSRTLPTAPVAVYVTSAVSPTDFQVQLVEEVGDLEQFADTVHSEMEAVTGALDSVAVGTVCGSKFSEDGFWYRAIVTELSGSSATVLFVDYGNFDKTDTAGLKPLTSSLLDKVTCCMGCSLAGVRQPSGGWSEHQIQAFKDQTADKELMATFSRKGDCVEVVLLDGEKNLAQDYTSQTHATEGARRYPHTKIPSSSSQVFVSHVVSPSEFYVNLVDQTNALDEMMGLLESVEGAGCSDNITPGQICAAIFADDGGWYRASVVRQAGDNYEVHYVDYGNSGTVDSSQIAPLPQNLNETAPFAIKCCLEGVQEVKEEELREKFVAKLNEFGGESEKELTAVFSSTTEPCKVQLSDGDLDVNKEIQIFVSQLTAETSGVSSLDTVDHNDEGTGAAADATPSVVDENYPTVPLPRGKCQAYISYLQSPAEIYLQLVKYNVDFEQNVDNVDAKYGYMHDSDNCLEKVSIGQLVCAKSTDCKVWYRAKVLDASGDEFTVRFVDYGNTDVVPLSNVKALAPEFRTVHEYSFLCCMAGASQQTTYTDEVIDKLDNLTRDKTLTVEILSDKVPYTIVMHDKEECINSTVLGESYADYQRQLETSTKEMKPEEVTLPEYSCTMGKSQVYVSAVVSPTEFYIQAAGSEGELEELAGELKAHYEGKSSSLQLTDPVVGQTCCTRYAEDGSWCRTRILQVQEDGLLVLFLDYGNSDTIQKSDLFLLQQEFSKQPRFAGKCTLSGLSPTESWPEETCDTFLERVQNVDLTVDVLDRKPDGTLDVKLFEGEVNIAEELFSDKLTTTTSAAVGRTPDAEDQPQEGDEPQKEAAPVDQESGDVVVDVTDAASADSTLQAPVVNEDAPRSPSTPLPATPSLASEAVSRPLNFVFAETPKKNQPAAEAKCVKLELNTKVEVFVSHTESVDEFYVQMKNSQDEFNKLLDEMQTYYESSKDSVEEITPEQIVVAKSEDGYWYRASVQSVEDDNVTVQFLDYGNTETVSNKLVQSVMSSFRELPFQAVCCSLDGVVPTGECWDADTINTFTNLTVDKCLLAEVRSAMEDSSYVINLLDMGIPISKTLIDQNLAKSSRAVIQSTSSECDVQVTEQPTPVVDQKDPSKTFVSPDVIEGSTLDVFVSNVETPDDIWCQLMETSHQQLPLLQDQIQDFCSNLAADEKVLQDVRPGVPCMAVYSDVWYRAQVTSVKDADNVEVCFVDYGNSEDIPSLTLKEVPSEIISLPKQAFQCKLSGIKTATEDGTWDQASCDRIVELLLYEEEKVFKLTVEEVHRRNEELVGVECRLRDGNTDIAEELVKEGYAQSFVSPAGKDIQESSKENNNEKQVQSQISVMVEKIIQDARAEVEAGLSSPDLSEACTREQGIAKVDRGVGSPAISETELQRASVGGESVEHGANDLANSFIDEQEEERSTDLENSFLEVSILRSNSVGSIGDDEVLETSTSDAHAYSVLRYTEDTTVDMLVLEARDPDNIVMQPLETADKLQEVMDKLHDLYSNAESPKLSNPQPSQRCCAQYTGDYRWYRAQIRKLLDDDLVEVYYVDFGNSEKIGRERLRFLEQDVTDLPAQAIKCTIDGIRSTSTVWSQEAGELIMSLCGDEGKCSVKVTRVDDDDRITGILITSDDKVVAGELITKKMAQPIDALSEPEDDEKEPSLVDSEPEQVPTTPPRNGTVEDEDNVDQSNQQLADTLKSSPLEVDQKHNVFLTHVVSPSHFWCQVSGEELGDIMEDLQDHYGDLEEEGEVKEWMEGDVCCAKSSEDMWYRAQIQSCYGNLATVRFVDFGNEEMIELKNIRPLLQKFADSPCFSVECELYGIKAPDGDWDEKCAELMQEEAGQPLCMKVKVVPESGPVVVTLSLRSGSNIADTLVSQRVARRKSVCEEKFQEHVTDNDINKAAAEDKTKEDSTENRTTQGLTNGQTSDGLSEDKTSEELSEDKTTEDKTLEELPVDKTTEGKTSEELSEDKTTQDKTLEELSEGKTTEDIILEELPEDKTTEGKISGELSKGKTTEFSTDDKTTEYSTDAKTTEDSTEDKTTEDSIHDKTKEDSSEDKTTEDSPDDKTTEDLTEDKTTEDLTGDKTTEDSIGDKTTEDSTEDKATEDSIDDKITENSPDDKTTEHSTKNETTEYTAEGKVAADEEEVTQDKVVESGSEEGNAAFESAEE